MAKLTKLSGLDLSKTQVSDATLASVAKLPELSGLYLSNTQVSDVSALAKLTKLSGLDLSGTRVLDLRSLRGLSLHSGLSLYKGLAYERNTYVTSFAGVRPSAKLTVNADGSVSMPAPRWVDGTVVAPSSTSPAGGVLDAKRGVVAWRRYDAKASYSYDFKRSFTVWDGDAVEFSGRVTGVKPTQPSQPSKPKVFTVSFDSVGGGRVASQSVVEGGRAVRPADPKRAGYVFAGWFTKAGKAFDFNSVVKADVALVAHWKSAAQPGKPTQPSKPSQPSKPTTPSKPSKPGKPMTPSKPAQPASDTVTMWRLYNPNSGEHFYTGNTAERDHLVHVGWKSEGTGWVAPAKSSEPVYRMYNPNAGDHHYTTNPAERDMLKNAGWSYEGVGWYSATNAGRAPLYREYNPNARSGAHNFTLNAAEDRYLGTIGWHREGTAWYAVHGL